MWAGGLGLVAFAILISGLHILWKLLALPVAVLSGVMEWRRVHRPQALRFSPESLECWLTNGRRLVTAWPLPGMACDYWVTFGVPCGRWRRYWITVYHDQLPAEDFRRLRILMH
ncbi:MAG: hypothetical protein CVV10_08585 [Gammaproteobacteria bacterium HGW-Gammaproteobacteria-14]|nr:MAG: hypothetical protein CVV10_08585 [Gammaproteobacteria bacterium HGW-Gammaproteobacteria-14]